VTGITLFDRDYVKQTTPTHAMSPRRNDVRNARGSDLAPQVGTAQVLLKAMRLVGGFFWWTTQEDGIVSVIDRLDFEDGLLARSGGIVSSPLAEWSSSTVLFFET
jgi:hypothetical protein